jgi:general secretion pathway protein G
MNCFLTAQTEFPVGLTELNEARNEVMKELNIAKINRIKAALRARNRGVTLMEVLIVVAILSLLAAGVTVAILPKFQKAAIDTTEQNARAIRGVIQRWRATNGGADCPTISQLQQDKEIDKASKTDDAWNKPFKIQCTGDDVIVSSSGPDKKDGTADDIVVPKGGAVN